jgi:hypothetical protein
MIQNKEVMENKFNFNSQVCTDKNQSERLLALGLKKETADMYWWNGKSWVYDSPFFADDEIPAWSLHRLLSLLPDYIVVNSSSGLNPNFYLNIRDGFVSYKDNRGFTYSSTFGNMYDAIISMISFLIKEGYFNKEYLVNQTEIEEHCKGVLEYLDYIREEE